LKRIVDGICSALIDASPSPIELRIHGSRNVEQEGTTPNRLQDKRNRATEVLEQPQPEAVALRIRTSCAGRVRAGDRNRGCHGPPAGGESLRRFAPLTGAHIQRPVVSSVNPPSAQPCKSSSGCSGLRQRPRYFHRTPLRLYCLQPVPECLPNSYFYMSPRLLYQ
jgi:hypothetical protein